MSADLQALKSRVTSAQATQEANQRALDTVKAEATQAGVVVPDGVTLKDTLAAAVAEATSSKETAGETYATDLQTLQTQVEEVERCQQGT